jgi:predicted O-methyltransferase YrrM
MWTRATNLIYRDTSTRYAEGTVRRRSAAEGRTRNAVRVILRQDITMNRRSIRNALKSAWFKAFRLGQHAGFDFLPRHFYSSVPDMRHLAQTRYWRQPLEMVGVSGTDLNQQLAFVAECCTPELREKLKTMNLMEYGTRENGEVGYGPIETDFLYCFIHTRKPPRIVQVGAGFSTAIILRAASDAGYDVKVTVIDPFPTDYLKRMHAAGRVILIPEMAQVVDRARLTDLGDSGMLFVDSTHTVKAGSEVNRIILDILPRLNRGAFVHFHDIYFPYDYQRNLMTEALFWSESTLLHAFLIGNAKYTIRCAQSMLHYGAGAKLRELLPNYRPQAGQDGLKSGDPGGHFPASCYLQVIA